VISVGWMSQPKPARRSPMDNRDLHHLGHDPASKRLKFERTSQLCLFGGLQLSGEAKRVWQGQKTAK